MGFLPFPFLFILDGLFVRAIVVVVVGVQGVSGGWGLFGKDVTYLCLRLGLFFLTGSGLCSFRYSFRISWACGAN
jgi:hypothetical protein